MTGNERRAETTVDLTPAPEVYLAAALAQQVAWRPDEDPDWQRRIAERMTTEPGFRVVVDAAYRAGREDAAREALINYADRHHHLGDGHGPVSTPSGWIDPDAWCACGASWSEDEGGCSERVQLLADAGDQRKNGFESMLRDPYEQFDRRSELLKSIVEYQNAQPSSASGNRQYDGRPECAELGHSECYEAGRRAGREDAIRGITADLRTVLDQRIMHSHERPGIWDDDCQPHRAGKSCVECAARARLEAALTEGEADRG